MNATRITWALLALTAAGLCTSFRVTAQTTGDAPKNAAAAAEPPANEAEDRGWPREFTSGDHVVRIFQPQLEDWPNFDRITFSAAISISNPGTRETVFGVLRCSADTKIAKEERIVVLTGRKIESVTFSDVSPAESEKLKAALIAAAPPEKPQTIALDRLVSAMDISKVKTRAVNVNLNPPKIYVSDKPAVIVIFAGKARFKPVAGSDLTYAINTNWDIFLDSPTSQYYLRDEESWLTTKDLDKGPWTAATTLPNSFSKIPDEEDWKDVRAAIPGKPSTAVPTVFVSHEPAELIVTAGAPKMEPIGETKLMAVANTDSDLFFHSVEKQFYFLAAGRWFAAKSLEGPWTAASKSLPEDFKKIPIDSDYANVLPAVPGTADANEAIIVASIPDKATVNRKDVTLSVSYQGEPNFKPIEGAPVQYAANSPFDVFIVEGKYYCCNNGVWFIGTSANGPWTVCDAVPPAIYQIPPTSPKYNVTYVTVYESTPDYVVTGYTSGYSGATVAATGAVMFGLGMLVGNALDDDDCWGYGYPPCYFSYGCAARYHGPYGGFVCGGACYGPYGGAGRWASYSPVSGTYRRGGAVYGPNGAAGYRAAYNPATGVGGVRTAGATPYGSWSRGVVTNGDQWVRGGQASGARGGSVAGASGSGGAGVAHVEGRYGNGATVVRDRDGDYYAGKDGNVYKRSENGFQQQSRAPYNADYRTSGEPRGATGSGREPRAATGSGGEPRAATGSGSEPRAATGARSEPGAATGQSDAGALQRDAASRDRGERNAQRTQSYQRAAAAPSGSRSGGGRSGGGGGGRR